MAESEGSSGLGKKLGPLPAWGWAVLLGGLGGIVWFLRKNQQAAQTTADTADTAGTSDTPAEPTTIVPVNQGLGEEQAQAILDAIKELQGEESEEPPTTTLPAPLPGPPPPKPPAPKPPPKPPAPKPKARRYVITKKWTRLRTPWQSTLWGIATHYKTPGGWQRLQKINKLHGDPKTHLKPGMKIYIE